MGSSHYNEIKWYYKMFFFLSWFCHVDDDIYVIVDNLVKLLSKMDPKTEARYIGKPLTYVVSSCVLNAVNT